jgi:hypothetical protein
MERTARIGCATFVGMRLDIVGPTGHGAQTEIPVPLDYDATEKQVPRRVAKSATLARDDDASSRRQIVDQVGIVDQGVKQVKAGGERCCSAVPFRAASWM